MWLRQFGNKELLQAAPLPLPYSWAQFCPEGSLAGSSRYASPRPVTVKTSWSPCRRIPLTGVNKILSVDTKTRYSFALAFAHLIFSSLMSTFFPMSRVKDTSSTRGLDSHLVSEIWSIALDAGWILDVADAVTPPLSGLSQNGPYHPWSQTQAFDPVTGRVESFPRYDATHFPWGPHLAAEHRSTEQSAPAKPALHWQVAVRQSH